MKKRFGSSDLVAARVVDRAIALPGQFLSYGIGAAKIRDLRARAERELGARFDLKGFHEVVLAGGMMPLDLLAERVEGWIAEVKARE